MIKIFKSKLFYSKYGQKLATLVLAAAPVLIYQVWKTSTDPILAAWNVQNITISPPIWELIVAYSPIFLVAFPGAYFAVKSGRKELRILLIWGCVGLLLLYVPWSLQRRFITGYMIPLAGLAAVAIDHLLSNRKTLGTAVVFMVAVLIIPTNLMVLAGGYQATKLKDENLFLSINEYESLRWIEANTDQEDVILASPSMGLYIPAYTGRRVWYGHPFETPDAATVESLVEDFFSGNHGGSDSKLLSASDYLFYGKRERDLGNVDFGTGYELVFESGDTRIYKID